MSIRNSAIGANVGAGEPREEAQALQRQNNDGRNEEKREEEKGEEDKGEEEKGEHARREDDKQGSRPEDSGQQASEKHNDSGIGIGGEGRAQDDSRDDSAKRHENQPDAGQQNALAEARQGYSTPPDTPAEAVTKTAQAAIDALTAANTRLRLITQITSQVVGAAPLDGQLTELARQARAAFHADACVVRALEGNELRLLASDGIPPALLLASITAGWGISGEIMMSRRPVVIPDTREHPATMSIINTLTPAYVFHAYAGTPLLAEGQVIGILGLYAREPGVFTTADGDDLQIVAYHIAVAIANDRLYRRITQQTLELEQQIADRLQAETALRLSMEQLQLSLEGTVSAMSSVVEMRDPYTAGHQRRVTALACRMAAHLGLPAPQIETLRIAGLLHDVGKIAVPAQILCKPTALLPPEWAIIQSHATVGHAILKDTALPAEVALVALQHHERLDGSGYPAGLRGDQIIAPAQLLAVADVVEAMVSDRPYRPGLPMEAALSEITRHRGTRYQAEAVDACMAVLAPHEYDLESLLATKER